MGDSLFVVDGGGDVAAARFGDATLIVTPASAAAPALGRSGRAARGGEGAAGTVAALAAALAAPRPRNGGARRPRRDGAAVAPERGFVLLGDGAAPLGAPWSAARGRDGIGVTHGPAARGARPARRRGRRRGRGRELRQVRSVVRNRIRAVVVAPVLVGDVEGFLHADRERLRTAPKTPRRWSASRRRSRSRATPVVGRARRHGKTGAAAAGIAAWAGPAPPLRRAPWRVALKIARRSRPQARRC